MASIYKRPKSPFWWVAFRDPKTGETKRESTGFRVGTAIELRNARELQAKKTLAERQIVGNSSEVLLEAWVPKFIDERFPGAYGVRVKTIWRILIIWFDQLNITRAGQITREHCLSYPAWRQKADKNKGKYWACKNTAILELKILAIILTEAQNREHIIGNPCLKLGLKRDRPKLRPEFSDEDIKTIMEAAELEPEPWRTMMTRSFMIARWHGVRLNETRVNPTKDVWEQQIDGKTRMMILFHQKGQREEPKILHPELVPLFKKLKAEGATETYPSKRWGNKWTKFFRKIGLAEKIPNVCFHSLRVTVVSRLARSGIEERKAMEYVTHASTTVHRAYVRWKPEDMDECHSAI